MGLFKRILRVGVPDTWHREYRWYDAQGRCVEECDGQEFRTDPDRYEREARQRGATQREKRGRR